MPADLSRQAEILRWTEVEWDRIAWSEKMRSSFWIGATGLYQHQQALDVVANNVSNVNTTAFKGSKIHFEDLFSITMRLGGAPADSAASSVNPVQKGLGVGLAAIQKNFNQGTPELTGRDLDLSIMGPGFFVVRAPDNLPNTTYYTRNGHFQISANEDTDSTYQGPINLVTSEGYTLQGVNSTIDPLTGEYVLPTEAALDDITIDPASRLIPFATTYATFGDNLDAVSPIAIDPQIFSQSTLGVDRSFRLEFQKAKFDDSNGDSYFFFKAQNPAQNADGSYSTLVDGTAGGDITGIVQLDKDGFVTGVYQNSDADSYLTTADIAALAPWARINGNGNPIFTVGTAPLTGILGEAIQRPEGGALTLATPAVFNVDSGILDVNSTVITLNGKTLANGVDYTETPATGTITPLTAWDTGDYSISYTTNGGTVQVTGETHSISNPSSNINFTLLNPPASNGTLVINATRNGAPLVENTDYSVDYEKGIISPITFWAPGAVTVNYDQADTRVDMEFGVMNQPLYFRNNLVPGNGLSIPAPRTASETIVGTAMNMFDSNGNEHSLSFSFERLSDHRWMWQATPTYRYEQDAAVITDGATGGGTTSDGMLVMPNTLIQNSDGTYDINIETDEGGGYLSWTQLPPTAAFPETGGSSRYFRVADPVTGAIEFSRDIDTSGSGFKIKTDYKSSSTTGDGIISFDANGYYDPNAALDPLSTQIVNPVSLTPLNANLLTIAPDFSSITQSARKSDVAILNSNGFKAGDLLKWSIDDSGRIVGDYSNGKQQLLARATLAKFRNPEGMIARGETTFLPSNSSGTRELIFANSLTSDGEFNGTTLIPKALETSNVDMADELSNMIIYQRAYQFNSRIVTTTDEMIKEAIGMKR